MLSSYVQRARVLQCFSKNYIITLREADVNCCKDITASHTYSLYQPDKSCVLSADAVRAVDGSERPSIAQNMAKESHSTWYTVMNPCILMVGGRYSGYNLDIIEGRGHMLH